MCYRTSHCVCTNEVHRCISVGSVLGYTGPDLESFGTRVRNDQLSNCEGPKAIHAAAMSTVQ